MKKVLLCVLIVFLLFGPKISIIDLSVLVPGLLLPFIQLGSWRLPRAFFELAVLLVILLVYQLLLQAILGTLDVELPGRLIRALLTTLIIGILFGESSGEYGRTIMIVLLGILLSHSILLIAAANNQPLNNLLGSITGNDRIAEYRASGLLAGFDIAGLFSIMGAAFLIFDDRLAQKFNALVLCLMSGTFLLACYFASRVSMALCALLFLFQMWRLLKSKNNPFWLKLVVIAILAWPAIYIGRQMFLIFDVTMSLGLSDADKETIAAIAAREAVQDPDSFLWADMIFLPHSSAQVIFGAGIDPLDSDVGYVKEIFQYGLLGLGAVVAGHLRFMRKRFEGARNRGSSPDRALVVFAFLMLMVLSAKNEYFLTRGFFPLFLLVVSACTDYAARRSELASRTSGGSLASDAGKLAVV